MGKLLTVSIAAYNAEAYLAKALKSCLVEGADSLEVIIVDDGSTDGTAAIADRYMQEHPALFRVIHKANGHYGSVFNTSLSAAAGTYFKLLDSDDWFIADGLSRLLRDLAETDSDIVINPNTRYSVDLDEEVFMDPCSETPAGEYRMNELDYSRIPGPGISNLSFRTAFLRDECSISLLEGCNYVDQELRILSWLKARSVCIEHYPVYCVLKGRDDQSTSLQSVCRNADDQVKLFKHILDQGVEEHVKEAPGSPSTDAAIRELADIVWAYYRSKGMSAPLSMRDKHKIKAFDRELRALSPRVFEVAGEKRGVRFLRKSGFLLYPLISLYLLRTWRY